MGVYAERIYGKRGKRGEIAWEADMGWQEGLLGKKCDVERGWINKRSSHRHRRQRMNGLHWIQDGPRWAM